MDSLGRPAAKTPMEMNYNEIFERMLKAGNLRSGAALARVLGITPQAVSNYRKRRGLPAGFIIKFALKYGVSVDWLLSGKGSAFTAVDAPGPGGASFWAAEEDEAFEGTGLNLKKTGQGAIGLTIVDPDELIYIGKLLKVLRSTERSAVSIVKAGIEASLEAVEHRSEPPRG
jgi:hypothetical protein